MIDVEELISLLCTLCDEKNLRVSVTESLKAGALTAVTTTAGGLLGGPVGLFVGAAAGGAVGSYMAWGKFEPVSTVLKNLNKGQKQILYDKAMAILNNLSCSDLATLTSLAMGDAAVKQRVIGTVVDHVSNELKMKIID